MKASEFVKKHGWDAVIDAVKSTNAEETAAFESTDIKYIDEANPMLGVNVKVYHIPYLEVKRLVESHEIIQSRGGMNRAKNTATLLQSSIDIGLYYGMDGVDANVELPLLKQAIADVELCQ